LAGTIKLIGGAKWVPELLDRNTKEWQILANEVQTQVGVVTVETVFDLVFSAGGSLRQVEYVEQVVQEDPN
jgi:hypothetical protein